MTVSIWSQHRYSEECCGHRIHYLRYVDALAANEEMGITPQDLADSERINNRISKGGELDDADKARVIEISAKENKDPYIVYSKCFEECMTPDECRTVIDAMPHGDAEKLLARLKAMADPVPQGVHNVDQVLGLIGIGLPLPGIAEVTVQQASVLVAISTARAAQQAAAAKPAAPRRPARQR